MRKTPSYLPTPFSPSVVSLMVSVDVKHHVYLLLRPETLHYNYTLAVSKVIRNVRFRHVGTAAESMNSWNWSRRLYDVQQATGWHFAKKSIWHDVPGAASVFISRYAVIQPDGSVLVWLLLKICSSLFSYIVTHDR